MITLYRFKLPKMLVDIGYTSADIILNCIFMIKMKYNQN